MKYSSTRRTTCCPTCATTSRICSSWPEGWELLQGRLDDTAIETIYARYLAGFTDIGSLVVVNGLGDLEEQDYVLFGRTQKEPFKVLPAALRRQSLLDAVAADST